MLLAPGKAGTGDRTLGGMRIWPPERSKLSALYYLTEVPSVSDMKILYLGASFGTTVSFLADYAMVIYAVEFSHHAMTSLLKVVQKHPNIIPFFADARTPEAYAPFIEEVDMVFQDIAQRDQISIFIDNLCPLKTGGYAILILKLESISKETTLDEICDTHMSRLKGAGIDVQKAISLEPYHHDHLAIIGIKKN